MIRTTRVTYLAIKTVFIHNNWEQSSVGNRIDNLAYSSLYARIFYMSTSATYFMYMEFQRIVCWIHRARFVIVLCHFFKSMVFIFTMVSNLRFYSHVINCARWFLPRRVSFQIIVSVYDENSITTQMVSDRNIHHVLLLWDWMTTVTTTSLSSCCSKNSGAVIDIVVYNGEWI